MKNIIRLITAVLTAICLFVSVDVAAKGQVRISGRILDSSGNPVVGVAVIEKGTANGTISDSEGNYTLTVEGSDAVLTFSCLGYIGQDQTTGNRSQINVTMQEDTLNINEVIVTGYGQTVTKDKLTAAISKVSSEVLERGAHSNVLQALSGSVTGTRISTTTGQPGSSPSIVIRGAVPLSGS